MVILVNNEKEKGLLEYFCDYLGDCGLDILEEKDEEIGKDFSSEDYRFLSNEFVSPKILVDPKVYPLTTQDDVCIGHCATCGQYIQGTIDGGDVTYEEYLEHKEKDDNGQLYCEDCWNKADIHE